MGWVFDISKKFNEESIYGIKSTADAHMMKNNEWGAVAYLSQSKYGKYGNNNYTGANKEVYINNYWNNGTLTGCSAGVPSAEKNETCAYTYEKELNGTGASTTGTIYRMYDMSGGASEYVMGVYRGSDAASTWGEPAVEEYPYYDYADFTSVPATKYYDEYITSDAVTACSSGICYGHSLSETSGWYSDNAYFVDATDPWLLRGGSYGSTTNAGVFAYKEWSGMPYASCSFRAVLLGL